VSGVTSWNKVKRLAHTHTNAPFVITSSVLKCLISYRAYGVVIFRTRSAVQKTL